MTLLRDGMAMLLVTAVALECDADIQPLIDGSKIRVIALRYWNGPAVDGKSTREIVQGDSEEAVIDLLGKENAPIVLLSKVGDTLSEVKSSSFGDDVYVDDFFAWPRRARLPVPHTRSLELAIKSGKTDAVAKLLVRELKKRNDAREENINGI